MDADRELLRLDLFRMVETLLSPDYDLGVLIGYQKCVAVTGELVTRVIKAAPELTAKQVKDCIDAYERLIDFAEAHDQMRIQACRLQRLHFSVAMLNTVSVNDDVALLSPRYVVQFALDNMGLPIERARELAMMSRGGGSQPPPDASPRWHLLERRQVFALRQIRMILNKILLNEALARDPRIAEWKDLYPLLP